jgi:hypothetical protein
MNVVEESSLKWPDSYERTRVRDRKTANSWRKTMRQSVELLATELKRMGATEVLITYNVLDKARQDPGVSVWFSRTPTGNYEWQDALGIDNPAPTIAEIDAAFKKRALPHHPDKNLPGADPELFKQLNLHRAAAIAWVRGDDKKELEFCIPCDKYEEQRWNITAIRLAIAAFRSLDRVGIPGMLERSFRGFRAALPAQASSEVKHEPVGA